MRGINLRRRTTVNPMQLSNVATPPCSKTLGNDVMKTKNPLADVSRGPMVSHRYPLRKHKTSILDLTKVDNKVPSQVLGNRPIANCKEQDEKICRKTAPKREFTSVDNKVPSSMRGNSSQCKEQGKKQSRKRGQKRDSKSCITILNEKKKKRPKRSRLNKSGKSLEQPWQGENIQVKANSLCPRGFHSYPVPPGVEDIEVRHWKKSSVTYGCEYAKDIFSFYRSHQHTHMPTTAAYHKFMKTNVEGKYQLDVVRSILIDKLFKMTEEFLFVNDTFYLAVSYLDRVLFRLTEFASLLQKKAVDVDDLNLAAITCLVIASKYEQTTYVPTIGEWRSAWSYMSTRETNDKELLKTELHVLKILDFRLTVVTSKVMVRRFLSASHCCNTTEKSLNSLCGLVALISPRLCLLCPPDYVAAVVTLYSRIVLSRFAPECLGTKELWSKELCHYSNHSMQDLEEGVLDAMESHKKVWNDFDFGFMNTYFTKSKISKELRNPFLQDGFEKYVRELF